MKKGSVVLLVAYLLALPIEARGTRIAVVSIVRGGGEMVPALVGGGYVRTCPVGPEAVSALREILCRGLERRGGWDLLPLRAQPQEGGEGELLPWAQEWGEAIGADLVLLGIVYCWRERIGSALGVERPAEVSLELVLLRVRDGRVLWGKLVQERQRPLSDDLFKIGRFLKKGFKWLTVRELAEVVVEEALRTMPEIQ